MKSLKINGILGKLLRSVFSHWWGKISVRSCLTRLKSRHQQNQTGSKREEFGRVTELFMCSKAYLSLSWECVNLILNTILKTEN